MRRIDHYQRELREQFDWESLKAEALSNPVEDGEYEDPVGLAFIGTVLALTPSGKFYTPWACSNVTPCPRCKGDGHLVNRKGDSIRYTELHESIVRDRLAAMKEHGPFMEGHWPEGLAESFRARDKVAYAVKPEHDCTWCGGTGSHEAAQDKDWHEALEMVATRHGMFVTSGEGDPCDLFVGIALEN